jgi:hypothetical protein
MYIGCEIITAAVLKSPIFWDIMPLTVNGRFFHPEDGDYMKNAVFWDVAPCRYFVNRRFGGTYRLHLQGIRNSRAIP